MMKQFRYLLLALCPLWVGSFLFTACSDSEQNQPMEPSSLWEYPHTYLMGLQGAVSTVKEEIFEAGVEESSEPFSTHIAQFDLHGRLTSYDPTGIIPATRMLGMEINRYSYYYDAQGWLTEVDIQTIGGEKVTYQLDYSETENHYVPLPFPLGTMEFFCVKGLITVEGSDGLVGSWQNDRFTWSKKENPGSRWEITTTTTCSYTALSSYPTTIEEEISMSGTPLSTETRHYSYDAMGTPTSCQKELTEGDEVIESSLTTYHSWPLMACNQISYTSGESMVTITYSYDNQHRPTVIRREVAGSDNKAQESMIYSDEDIHGNWTRSNQQWNELVNANHPDAEVRIQRSFSYNY